MTRLFDQFASQFELTSTQMSIIDYLVRRENQITLQQDIEYEFNIQRSTTCVLLQRMEKKELIYRKKVEEDGRQRSIHLTEKAHEIADELSEHMNKHQRLVEQTFTEEELATFYKILDFFIQQKE